MAVKFLYYFVFTFIGIAGFLIFQKPYVIDKKVSPNMPLIVMNDVKNFDITTQGVVSFTSSNIVRRFKTHDEFEKVNMLKKSDTGYVESVSADLGVLKKNDLKLKKNVRYDRSDGLNLVSEEVDYNLKTKVLTSDVPFILSNERGTSYGNSFVYKTDEGIISATKIKAIIKEEKK